MAHHYIWEREKKRWQRTITNNKNELWGDQILNHQSDGQIKSTSLSQSSSEVLWVVNGYILLLLLTFCCRIICRIIGLSVWEKPERGETWKSQNRNAAGNMGFKFSYIHTWALLYSLASYSNQNQSFQGKDDCSPQHNPNSGKCYIMGWVHHIIQLTDCKIGGVKLNCTLLNIQIMELQVIHTHSVYLDQLHPKPLFCKLSAFKRIDPIGQMCEINRCIKCMPMRKGAVIIFQNLIIELA